MASSLATQRSLIILFPDERPLAYLLAEHPQKKGCALLLVTFRYDKKLKLLYIAACIQSSWEYSCRKIWVKEVGSIFQFPDTSLNCLFREAHASLQSSIQMINAVWKPDYTIVELGTMNTFGYNSTISLATYLNRKFS